ncbi:MAG: hypothetical protein GY791_08105 [Alphaproteobacteria bacterium]|nr:hypothetical protein [Alphaproteobacteria bacterium]
MSSSISNPLSPPWAYDPHRLAIVERRYDGLIPAPLLEQARHDPAAMQIARLSGQAHTFRWLAGTMIAALRRHPGNTACRRHLHHYFVAFRTWNGAAWSLRRHQKAPLPRGRDEYESALRATLSLESSARPAPHPGRE